MGYKHKYKLNEVFYIDYYEKPDKPSEVFRMCGEYKVVGLNKGDSQGGLYYLVEKMSCGSDMQPTGFTVYINESVLDSSKRMGVAATIKTIPKGSFILITDYRNNYDRYLKVGEVIDVENEGYTEVKYEVRFGGNYIDYDDVEYFGKELSEQCRILKFESQ